MFNNFRDNCKKNNKTYSDIHLCPSTYGGKVSLKTIVYYALSRAKELINLYHQEQSEMGERTKKVAEELIKEYHRIKERNKNNL